MHRAAHLAIVVATTAVALTVQPGSAAAAAGDLDPSFGSGGKLSFGVTPAGQDNATGVAIQPDGKIVVGGYSDDVAAGLNVNCTVARRNTDGSLDPSFGSGGFVNIDLSGQAGNTDFCNAVALAQDGSGSIFVAGTSFTGFGNTNQDVAVAKLTAGGALDDSFDGDSGVGNGIVTTSVATGGGISDLGVDLFAAPDGKLTVLGLSEDGPTGYDFAFVRYRSDGKLDTGFDGDSGTGNGIVRVPIGPGNGYDSPSAIAPAPGDKIMAVGSAVPVPGNGTDFATVRLLSDGRLDTSFQGGGLRTDAIGPGNNGESASDVTVYEDGRIIEAGYANVGPGNTDAQFALVRLTEGGGRDTSFSGDGVQTTEITPGSTNDNARALVLQPDGRIVLGGSSTVGPDNDDYALARYNADGSPDTTFSPPDGVTTTAISPKDQDIVRGLALAPDGKIVAAGDAAIPGGSEMSAARYLADPAAAPRSNGEPDSNIDPVSKAVKTAGAIVARRKRSKPRRFTGSASDDSAVAKVEIALAKVGRGSGTLARRHKKRRKSCTRLTRKGKLKRSRARKGACTQSWLAASGATSWSFRLPKRLPKGRYVLFSRATDNQGLSETSFSASDHNRIAFRVR